MTSPYPVSVADFKAWKAHHEERAHTLLRADDPRVKARGIVCLECQDWCKVLVADFDHDAELVAWAKKHSERASCRAEDFKWERSKQPVFYDDFSMTSNYYK